MNKRLIIFSALFGDAARLRRQLFWPLRHRSIR